MSAYEELLARPLTKNRPAGAAERFLTKRMICAYRIDA